MPFLLTALQLLDRPDGYPLRRLTQSTSLSAAALRHVDPGWQTRTLLPLCARSTPGVRRDYGYVVVGVAFSDPRVDGARRTLVVCRRRLTLLRLTPWVVAREAAVTR